MVYRPVLLAVITLFFAADLDAEPPPSGPVIPAVALSSHHAVEACPDKICVTEMKATTKTVHNSVCKEYCLPHRSLLSILKSCCGLDDGACGECGEVRTRSVLVKKIVPGPMTPVCAIKDLSAPAVPPKK